MRRRGTPVSREALYEAVWTDAVTLVAPRYGLSDVGLVKICKKLGIPVPPRGYWAKIKAGRPSHKRPLPSLPAGARDLTGPIPLSEPEVAVYARVRDALQKTRESQSNISLPAELRDPHPLVRAAAARLKRRDGWDHPAGVRSAPKEVLELQLTRHTHLVAGSTTLTISIVSVVTRTSHTPTRLRCRRAPVLRLLSRGCPGRVSEYPAVRLALHRTPHSHGGIAAVTKVERHGTQPHRKRLGTPY